MKNYNLFILLLILLVLTNDIMDSQELPKSFQDSTLTLKPINEIEAIITNTPNVDSLNLISDSLYQVGLNHPEFYGYAYNYEKKINSNGTWDTLINGDRIWRFHIICPGAKTVNIVLDSLKIGKNSFLSFYNERNESLLGPYNNRINSESKIFSSHLIEGQSVFIELFEPKEDFGENVLNIRKVVYGYEEMNYFSKKNASILESDECNIDANCPKGDDYCKEKYSLVLFIRPANGDSWGRCSGSLINNTDENYKPYLLTGFHCLDIDKSRALSQAELDRLNQWGFQFGYLKSDCNSVGSLQTKTYSGAYFRAAWYPTDFLLIELKTQPISGENNFPDVYFNGWDRSGNIPKSVATLHHPSADFMKISIDEDSPLISGYLNYYCETEDDNDRHWKTFWDYGTTEGVSSGGPLYDESTKKVIGQLRGGCASCDDPDEPDYFGRLSKSWEGGGTSDTRLKDWLDPNNTGVTELDGIKMPNLQFGKETANSITETYNAYSNMHIGSSITDSYIVQSGGDLTLKAGREIKISGCTQIKAGSEFHAYIEEPDCDDVVLLSDKITDHDPSICSLYPKLVKEDQDFDTPLTSNSILTISPNPVTSISDISLTVSTADNVSLMLYDNLGNQRFTYLDNISLMSGTYNYKLDGNELNSGMFVLVLKIDGRIVTEKIINLK